MRWLSTHFKGKTSDHRLIPYLLGAPGARSLPRWLDPVEPRAPADAKPDVSIFSNRPVT